MSGNIQTQLNQLSANVQVLNSSLANITGNTLSNYNLISRIVADQANINTRLSMTGNITTGNLVAQTGLSNIGIGLGQTTGTVVGVIQNNDNYGNNIFTPVTINSSDTPYGQFTRYTSFLFASSLTVSTPVTVITITFPNSGGSEAHLYIKIEAIIVASTTNDSSTKTFNALISGSTANNGVNDGVYSLSSVELSSVTSSVTPAALNLGATSITYPTNDGTTLSIALTQSITGTPSQALYVSGQCSIQHALMNGSTYITSISI